MTRSYEEPKQQNGYLEHPAFGQIEVSRTYGQSYLYGSDFSHRNTIRLTVSKSHLEAESGYPHTTDELITVELSEAQWANLISSMNVGGGSQCTVIHINGEQVPTLPAPKSRSEQTMARLSVFLQRAAEELEQLIEELRDLKVSDKAKRALISRVAQAHVNLISNTDYLHEHFGKEMEKTVEKAKIEINAYATSEITRLGLAQKHVAPAISYEQNAKEE